MEGWRDAAAVMLGALRTSLSKDLGCEINRSHGTEESSNERPTRAATWKADKSPPCGNRRTAKPQAQNDASHLGSGRKQGVKEGVHRKRDKKRP